MEKYGKYIDICFSNKPVQMFVDPTKNEMIFNLITKNYKLPILSTSLTSGSAKFCYTFADTVDEHVIRMHFPKGEENNLDNELDRK